MNRIDRKQVENLGKARDGKKRRGREDEQLNNKYSLVKENLDEVFSNFNAYDMSLNLTFLDHWMFSRKDADSNHCYQRSEIVYSDLGAFNFGYEISYPHPCIVLADNKYFTLVLPCSTKKYGRGYPDILDGTIADGFTTNTGVVIDGLRWIAKERIIGRIGRVTPEMMARIEERLMAYFPNLQRQFAEKDQTILQLQKEVSQLRSQQK